MKFYGKPELIYNSIDSIKSKMIAKIEIVELSFDVVDYY